jgi:hypothetical protein
MKRDDDLAVLIVMAAALLGLHALTNGQYGFHRDELSTLADAASLDWGYVGVPPLTPFLARVAFAWFGPSLAGLRFFSSLAMAVAFVLTGLMARHMGGGRFAQGVAAVSAAISGVALSAGALFEYVSLDYLWWVMAAYFVTRLLASNDARAWLGVGAAVGLGLMTKYSIVFLMAGIGAGIVFTPARRYVRSGWLWGGVALAFAIFLPNLIWQIRHDFVTLDFLRSIHTRDVQLGRTDGFLSGQFWIATNAFTVPLWIAGLVFLFTNEAGRRFRMLGWMFVIPLALFVLARGRDYYMAPAYPMLLAAGAVWCERWVKRWLVIVLLATGGLLWAAPVLPIAPVDSAFWRFADRVNGGNFNEQIGWPELAQTVAQIRATLPAQTGILVADTAQAEAIDLYAPELPAAISVANSHWFRGYGNPPPKPLIAVGFPDAFVQRHLASCVKAGSVGLENSSIGGKNVFVCEGPIQPWPRFWQDAKHYG